MPTGNLLPSQIEFRSLSVADMQHETCEHVTMGHDAFSRGGSSDSAKSARLDRDPYVPVNYISPEACAMLLAAEESAARCADAMDASAMQLDATYYFPARQSAMDGVYDPERTMQSMAPPKRFNRTFWLSISLKLLYRWTQSAKSCKSVAIVTLPVLA